MKSFADNSLQGGCGLVTELEDVVDDGGAGGEQLLRLPRHQTQLVQPVPPVTAIHISPTQLHFGIWPLRVQSVLLRRTMLKSTHHAALYIHLDTDCTSGLSFTTLS